MRYSLLPGHHENHLIWVDSSLIAPLELALSFECLFFACLSTRPSSRLTVPRTIWSEFTGSDRSPLACSKILLECLLRKLTYIYYAFIAYSALQLTSVFLFFVQSNLQSKCSFQLTCSSRVIVQSLFNYCSVFWSWKSIACILIP